jgi:1-acyl-sn-glycerol-3-phosphate acyltransferase
MTFKLPTYFLSRFLLGGLFNRYFAEVKGREHIPIGIGFVIAANHIDNLDGIYLGTLLGKVTDKRVYFISRTNNYWFYRSTIKIPKENKDRIIERSLALLRQGFSICYFPEGARNSQATLLPFKTGVARTAMLGGVSVLPIGLIGPSGASFLDSVLLLMKGGRRLTINIGAPIRLPVATGELNREQLDIATRQVAEAVGRLCNKR